MKNIWIKPRFFLQSIIKGCGRNSAAQGFFYLDSKTLVRDNEQWSLKTFSFFLIFPVEKNYIFVGYFKQKILWNATLNKNCEALVPKKQTALTIGL